MLNEAINKWIAERQESYETTNKVALFLRPFLFWLDKKLDKLFTDGFRLVRIHWVCAFIPQSLLQAAEEDENPDQVKEALFPIPPSFTPEVEDDDSSSSESSDENQRAPLRPAASGTRKTDGSDTSEDSGEDEQESAAADAAASADALDSIAAPAYQQRLTFEGIELRGQAGTCLFTRLPVFCSCSRCKYLFEWVFRLPAQQPGQQLTKFNSIPPHTSACPRCRQPMGLTLEASLVHGFSGLIGTFGMANCILSDIQLKAADAVIHCTNCNTDVKTTVSATLKLH